MNCFRPDCSPPAAFDYRRASSFSHRSTTNPQCGLVGANGPHPANQLELFPSLNSCILLLAINLGLTLVPAAHGQSTRVLREEVSRLSTNDRTQDIRLSHLERDVDILQRKASYTPRPPSSGSATSSGKSGKESQDVTPTASTYTVRPGDTLWRIAMNHRVSPGEIMQHNKMSSDSVKTGQKLAIPSKSVTTYSPPPVKTVQKTPNRTTAPSTGRLYQVKPGDSFSQIASRHNISQAALQQANPGVNPNLILIGSSLNIPIGAAPPPPPAQSHTQNLADASTSTANRHTVRPGDTLSSVASRYGVSLAALQKANSSVDPNRLKIGQMLTLPAGTTPAPNPPTPSPPPPTVAKTPTAPAATPKPLSAQATAALSSYPVMTPQPQANPRGVLQYRVDSTDTLESIARTFTTTPELIRELNGMGSGVKIKPNDEIFVPAMGAVAPER